MATIATDPLPAACLRVSLSRARRAGDRFDEAWQPAIEHTLATVAPLERPKWLIVFEQTRWAWHRAYNRRDVVTRALAAELLDAA